MSRKRKKRTLFSNPKLKYLLPAAVLLAGGAAALELTNTINFIHKSSQPSAGTTDDQPQNVNEKPTKTNKTGATAPKSAKSPAVSVPSGAVGPLLSPYQSTYVNNHNPSSINTELQSVCVTSPGAACTMEFSRIGIVKKLPLKTTGSDGSAEWEWTPSQLGLTAGSWTITAKATAGGATKTSQDGYKLTLP